MERTDGNTGRGGHPIFAILAAEGRSKLWLARRAGISHSHVRNVASGMFRPGPEFRRKCAAAMALPEADLFDQEATPARPPMGGPSNRAGIAETEEYPPQEALSIRRST